ncbi:MAG: Metallophosphoesterase [Halothiobacillaceae bacterium]|nr:MAG: Metallophosphoesterase [Halothiobacillaceae bacterium]
MKIFRMVTALLLTLGLLSGCGGGSGGGSTTGDDNGSLVIGITDAEGDFLAYAVDVTSIKLTHADGRVVETLPQSSRVDFAQYVDLTEFVTAATIPNGRYTKASLVLDYSNADVQVEVDGNPVQAQVRDSQGNVITTREVEVTLDSGHPLVIAPGVAKHLTLDFDLQTSNSVDTSVNPPVVTAEPLLVADVEMDNPKPHRLRGLLKAVDQSQNLIQLQLRPFHRHDGEFGTLDAYVNDGTNYEIDGVAYSGRSGLTQLALQPLTSWIVLFGEINTTTGQFVASEVYAGSSVPGSSQDAVTGVVTARSGDQLTVRARAIVRTDGSLIFNKDVTVMLDADTTVTRQLSKNSATIGDISVGQRLDLLGTITDSDGALTMAATKARMMLTLLSGNAVSMNDGELVVNLQHLEGMWI